MFRGVREAASLVEQGQFVLAWMIIKRISAILRHCIVLLAMRAKVKSRHGAAAPPPLRRIRCGRLFHSQVVILCSPQAKLRIQAYVGLIVPKAWIPGSACGEDRMTGGGLARKLAGLRAALLNPMPYVRRLARKLYSNAIVFKSRIPRTTPKTTERDYWERRVAAAEEARFALSEFWRIRRDSS
jgi:hypothetical protein